jgi:hypothetical protein
MDALIKIRYRDAAIRRELGETGDLGGERAETPGKRMGIEVLSRFGKGEKPDQSA